MRRSLSAVVVGGCLALLAGCVAGEDSDSAAQDLTGGVAQARACAVQSAYLDAPLDAFKWVAFDKLPEKLQTRLTAAWGDDPFESSSQLMVRNVGQVYVLEQATANGSTIEFFDVNSDPIATATTRGSWLTFRLPYTSPAGGDGGASSTAALQCGYGTDAGFPYDGGSPDASSWDGGSYPHDGGAYDASPYDASPWYPSTDAGDAG